MPFALGISNNGPFYAFMRKFSFFFFPLASYRWCCFPKSPDNPATVTGEPDSIAMFDGKAKIVDLFSLERFPKRRSRRGAFTNVNVQIQACY